MERPEPIRMQSTSDLEKKVEAFKQKHGVFGTLVLECFNVVDPLRCGTMPDEYFGYAERFVKALPAAQVTSNQPEALALFMEVVRRCFYPTQLAEGFVSPDAIRVIASGIQVGMRGAGLTLDTSKWPQNV